MKAAATLILSLTLAVPVLADDAITVFGGGFSREQLAKSSGFTRWNGEVGVAASHAWNRWWSAEASIAYRQSHSFVSEFIGNTPVTSNKEIRTLPVDASMRFHLANGSRWKPYVSAGARYVNASNIRENDLTPDANGLILVRTKRADDRLSAEVGAGMSLMLTHGFGVRGDVKRLLRSDDSPFDPLNRATFGMEWKF